MIECLAVFFDSRTKGVVASSRLSKFMGENFICYVDVGYKTLLQRTEHISFEEAQLWNFRKFKILLTDAVLEASELRSSKCEKSRLLFWPSLNVWSV